MTDDNRTRNVAALASAVDAETTAAYSRKTSLETRAGSIVVAAGAVVTVFLTLRQALGLDLALLEPIPAWLVLVGLIAAGVALLAGIAGALPIKYAALDGEFLRVLLRDDLDRGDMREELVDLRAVALSRITTANAIKGTIVLVGYILVVVVVALLALALVVAGRLVA